MAGGYAVLAYCDSSSSDAVYQVRRGGDGVLYCTCRGWVANLNAQKRGRIGDPAQCRHTKEYVADHPGTSYGPAFAKPKPATAAKPGKKIAVATSSWRDLLLQERRAAEVRGVQTPAPALAAFDREIVHLDLAAEGIAAPAEVAAAELDVE